MRDCDIVVILFQIDGFAFVRIQTESSGSIDNTYFTRETLTESDIDSGDPDGDFIFTVERHSFDNIPTGTCGEIFAWASPLARYILEQTGRMQSCLPTKRQTCLPSAGVSIIWITIGSLSTSKCLQQSGEIYLWRSRSIGNRYPIGYWWRNQCNNYRKRTNTTTVYWNNYFLKHL